MFVLLWHNLSTDIIERNCKRLLNGVDPKPFALDPAFLSTFIFHFYTKYFLLTVSKAISTILHKNMSNFIPQSIFYIDTIGRDSDLNLIITDPDTRNNVITGPDPIKRFGTRADQDLHHQIFMLISTKNIAFFRGSVHNSSGIREGEHAAVPGAQVEVSGQV